MITLVSTRVRSLLIESGSIHIGPRIWFKVGGPVFLRSHLNRRAAIIPIFGFGFLRGRRIKVRLALQAASLLW